MPLSAPGSAYRFRSVMSEAGRLSNYPNPAPVQAEGVTVEQMSRESKNAFRHNSHHKAHMPSAAGQISVKPLIWNKTISSQVQPGPLTNSSPYANRHLVNKLHNYATENHCRPSTYRLPTRQKSTSLHTSQMCIHMVPLLPHLARHSLQFPSNCAKTPLTLMKPKTRGRA